MIGRLVGVMSWVILVPLVTIKVNICEDSGDYKIIWGLMG